MVIRSLVGATVNYSAADTVVMPVQFSEKQRGSERSSERGTFIEINRRVPGYIILAEIGCACCALFRIVLVTLSNKYLLVFPSAPPWIINESPDAQLCERINLPENKGH